MQPITIFCAFTRPWAMDRWIENLQSLKYDPALINLAIIIDADYPKILKRFRKLVEEKGYRGFEYAMNTDFEPNEVRVARRRYRIAEVKNQSKELIARLDGEIIIGLEDDTVFEDFAVNRLIGALVSNEDVGFVQGVQCGRWGIKMIGAWELDNIFYPKRASTMLPPEDISDIGEITAGGFYGYATRKRHYLDHDYHISSNHPWGPDVNYGLWLQQNGYKCLIDWQTVFGHNDHNVVLYPDEKSYKVVYTRGEDGKWSRTDER